MIGSSIEITHKEEIARGDLNSWQSLRFDGPPHSESVLPLVLDFMEESHLRAIRLSSLGLMSIVRSGVVSECRLLNRWLSLSFRETETISENRRLVRRYEIGSGAFSRKSESSCGCLSMGAEIETERDDWLRWRLWSEVEGYPSRFLTPLPASPILRGIGRIYASYHRRVTIGFLKRTALRLRRGDLR